MPQRVLGYLGRIWEDARANGAKRLPVVIPIVLYHGQGEWKAARSLVELLDVDPEMLAQVEPFIPNFHLLIDDLARTPELALLERPGPALMRLVAWALRAHAVGYDPAQLGRWAALLAQAVQHAEREALEVFFRYLADVETVEGLLDAVIDADADPEVREVAMGLRHKWEEKARSEGEARGRAEGERKGRAEGERKGRAEGERKGRAEGERKGRAEGERKGRAATVLKLLRLRFGPLDDEALARVRAASLETLEVWTERVLTAQTLDELWAD